MCKVFFHVINNIKHHWKTNMKYIIVQYLPISWKSVLPSRLEKRCKWYTIAGGVGLLPQCCTDVNQSIPTGLPQHQHCFSKCSLKCCSAPPVPPTPLPHSKCYFWKALVRKVPFLSCKGVLLTHCMVLTQTVHNSFLFHSHPISCYLTQTSSSLFFALTERWLLRCGKYSMVFRASWRSFIVWRWLWKRWKISTDI